ncbi:type II toxin-antitoxin system RelE/ParE family toxin [Luteolibacter yonseiensis]|uniref:Type II toxin-antitoxin system RelE/ParE family toxin n=1 Tax=Luteolibacter yonseiensis TaxID=1144680 RepID=A0A934V5M8_9BACT|nr:type II toxin-antitoxin system RelE/ParE family toxin [Luteolibacter yonseiensis]
MKPLRYHPSVQRDIHEAMRYYLESASENVASRFWNELLSALSRIQAEPDSHHFDPSGLRRHNMSRFPYHILFQNLDDRIRIQVIRHNSRSPNFGAHRKRD